MNSILLRRRNEMQQEETRHEEDLPEENHEARSDIDNNDTDNNGVVEEQADELTEDDKEPVWFFQIKIESMNHWCLLQLEPHEKLLKVKLTKKIEGSANRILDRYLINVRTIPEITDEVYGMGKAIKF